MEDLPYTLRYSKGEHLILHLITDEIFEGDLIDTGANRIDLINTRQHNNTNKLGGAGGICSFYRYEIKNITRPNPRPDKWMSHQEDNGDKLKLVEEEYFRLKKMALEYTYIERVDTRYYDAMKKLAQAETIGICPLGMGYTRTGMVKLLAISTWQEVFLLDLLDHKNRYFYPELRKILESEYVCKIIFKGSPFVDMLYRNYGIYIQNTFDPQVVDLIIQKTKTGTCPKKSRNLGECLTTYLKLPSSFLSNAVQSTKNKWVERPLEDMDKLYASQLVAYLTVLKIEMEKILMSKTYGAIDRVHDFYHRLDEYQFSVHSQKSNVPKDVQAVIPSLKNIRLDDSSQSSDKEAQSAHTEST